MYNQQGMKMEMSQLLNISYVHKMLKPEHLIYFDPAFKQAKCLFIHLLVVVRWVQIM